MKQPTFDWERSSDEFITNLGLDPDTTTRREVEEIFTDDIARAQRMAAAGVRHLQAIRGANKNKGDLDRWKKDAIAPVYFGRTNSVTQIDAVHRRLERAHRRLRDKSLTIRMREQRRGGERGGRNCGGPASATRFELFSDWATMRPPQRSALIIHELMHDWLRDYCIDGQWAYGNELAIRLAHENRTKARRNPNNYEQFVLQVWRDEGLEAPSGADGLDQALDPVASARSGATGLLADRPVLAAATADGRRDVAFVALRTRANEAIIPAVFEHDGPTIERRRHADGTDPTSYPASCCTLPDGTVVMATRTPRSKRLILTAWEVRNETSKLLAESGGLYGDTYSQPDIAAVGGGRLCVVFKTKNGRMKVDLASFQRGRGFERHGSAETSGPIHDHARVCLVLPLTGAGMDMPQARNPNRVVVATAMRTREGRLSVNAWSGDFERRKVERRGGLVDQAMTGRPAITALGRTGNVVTAVRDQASGRLRLTAFNMTNPARPRRLGDSGDFGPRMSHSPDLVTVPAGTRQQVATAIRYSVNGRLIVSTWRLPRNARQFSRRWHSGSADTPEILGTPSLIRVPGGATEDLLTAAVGADSALAMHRWGVAQVAAVRAQPPRAQPPVRARPPGRAQPPRRARPPRR